MENSFGEDNSDHQANKSYSLYYYLTCKEYSIQQYRFLLLLILLMNILMFFSEIVKLIRELKDHYLKNDSAAILCLIATIITGINALLILKLIINPTTRSALASSCIIVFLELLYILQISFYSNDFEDPVAIVVVTIFLLLQLYSALLLYRYWEFVLFYYNDGFGLNDSDNMRFSDLVKSQRSGKLSVLSHLSVHDVEHGLKVTRPVSPLPSQTHPLHQFPSSSPPSPTNAPLALHDDKQTHEITSSGTSSASSAIITSPLILHDHLLPSPSIALHLEETLNPQMKKDIQE